jgi:hypothetical protein
MGSCATARINYQKPMSTHTTMTLTQREAEANIQSFLAYFMQDEDYLNVASDPSVTFYDIVSFMSRLSATRELS